MRNLFPLLLLLLAPLAEGAPGEKLIGSWHGGDTASMSIYGTLTITAHTISWDGCTVEYKLKDEEPGIEFKNQTRRKFVTGAVETYLLEITGGDCAQRLAGFRFTFDLPQHDTYLAMIEYSKKWEPVGYMHFHKD